MELSSEDATVFVLQRATNIAAEYQHLEFISAIKIYWTLE